MNPYERWDDWEWERAAYEIGRDSEYNRHDRGGRGRPERYYFNNKTPESLMDKWTGGQKRVVLSALLFLTIVFSSRGEDVVSKSVFSLYKNGMESGNFYMALNSMAKEAMGVGGQPDALAVTVPIQSIFYPPVAGAVKVGFQGTGYNGSLSQGIEIESTIGTPVLCPEEGVVLEVSESDHLGQIVRINFGNGWEGTIGNLGEVNVKRGDPVSMGYKLGTVGIGSLRQKPWLYLELSKDGNHVDPLMYLIRN